MLRWNLFVKSRNIKTISIFFISLGRVVPSPKIVINLPGTYEKLPCSAVSEILRYKQTQTETHPVTLVKGYVFNNYFL